MLKQEIIKQYDGFGNKRPKTTGEYFRSSGFSKTANGIASTRYQYSYYASADFIAKFPQYASLGDTYAFAFGKGRTLTDITGGTTSDYMYSLSSNGRIFSYLTGIGTPNLVYDANVGRQHFGNTQTGLIADQKNRLLYVGDQYLGLLDLTADDATMTVSVTNGNATLTKTAGTDFDAGMANKVVRIKVSSTYYYYRIQTYTDTTHVDIYGTVDAPTGSYTAYVLSSWEDRWKDFGSSVTGVVPTETYEDTVLFGRANNVVTLNTLTDSITTDASPAFNLPTGFTIEHIHKGTNGILLGCNFQRKGVLVLWDNFSDRSIAQWIQLPDKLLTVTKHGGNWLIMTTREIYLTNGYSLESTKSDFLDSGLSRLSMTLIPQSSVVIENDFYFSLQYSGEGKRRSGLYKMDLTSKLFEFYPRGNFNQYDGNNHSIFYLVGDTISRLYTGCSNSVDILVSATAPSNAVYITNPVGEGETKKVSKQIKVQVRVPLSYYSIGTDTSFTIIAKLFPMKNQMLHYAQIKSIQTVANEIVVDESVFTPAVVGQEVEFLEDNNAGYTRNITSIDGGGTSTATYTLDRDLPALSGANDNINITSFQLIKVKEYTSLLDLEEIIFDVKNSLTGRHFMIKIEFEDLTVPVELQPLVFIYDDLGTL